MKRKIKYSCVIPCYNVCAFIDRAIESLERQTNKNFEVLFIDDCSTDNSYFYLTEKLPKMSFRAKILQMDKNMGPGAARNLGIENAQGEYISFLDSDDWYEDDFFEVIEDNIGHVDILYFNFLHSANENKKKKVFVEKSINCRTKKDYIVNAPDSLCRCVFKKKLFSKIQIPAMYFGEDMAVVPILFSLAESIAYCPHYLYNYCYRGDSLSNMQGSKIVESFMKANSILENCQLIAFQEEIEYLSVKIVLYAIPLVVLRSKIDIAKLNAIIIEFEKHHHKWVKNKYINRLPFYKKLFLWCVNNRCYFLLSIYVSLHTKLLKNNVF